MRVMRPSFVSLLMRPTAPPIWLGIAVAASLIVIETVSVVYLKRLTGQPFGTLYTVDVVFLFVALSANTIAAAARTGERFSGRSSDLLAIAGPERLIQVNRACERYRLFPAGSPASAVVGNLSHENSVT
ncbi:MAG TPA: hypothetical protein VMU34_14940 [Mycobacterium sp.]|nr:hypothetical protein [Mycobacterium sp.]